jgi:hypothetical protein
MVEALPLGPSGPLYPAGMALGASWNLEVARERARSVARDTRARTPRTTTRALIATVIALYWTVEPAIDAAGVLPLCSAMWETKRHFANYGSLMSNQVKRTQISATPVSSVAHVSPTDTGNVRVKVPVVTISPAPSAGLT